jgi:branched-chain amino acid transport system permease protein
MLGQQIVNGIAIGMTYGLLALGLSVAYSSTRIVNFAHGEFFAFGALLGVWIQRTFRMPYPVAAAFAVATVFTLGFLASYFLLEGLRSQLQRAAATIALALGLQDAMLLLFGSDNASFPGFVVRGSFHVADLQVPRSLAVIAGTSAVLVLLFTLTLWRSRLGVWMRATADDPLLARVSGLPTRRMHAIAFGMSVALAAAAGLLVGPTSQVNYASGVVVAVKAFTAAVIGGFGNLFGAIVGGVLLGVAEAMIAGYGSSAWKDLEVFALLAFLMLVLPRGIFAGRTARVG